MKIVIHEKKNICVIIIGLQFMIITLINQSKAASMKYNKTVEGTYCNFQQQKEKHQISGLFSCLTNKKHKNYQILEAGNYKFMMFFEIRVLPHLKCLHTFNISHKCRHSQLKHKHHLTRHLEISGRLKCLLQRGTMSSYGLMNSLVAVVQTHCHSLSEWSVTVLRCSTG